MVRCRPLFPDWYTCPFYLKRNYKLSFIYLLCFLLFFTFVVFISEVDKYTCLSIGFSFEFEFVFMLTCYLQNGTGHLS